MQVREEYGKDKLMPELDDLLNAKLLPDDFTIEDWPYGRSKRCSMHFWIEPNKKGDKMRMVKQSTFNGRTNKPKKCTYAEAVVMLEIDGKVFHVEFSTYGMATIYPQDSQYVSVSFYDNEFAALVKKYIKRGK